MKKFYRKIENITICIFVDNNIYDRFSIVLHSILRSFSICTDDSNESESSYNFYIISEKDRNKYPSDNRYVILDINDDSWMFELINDLEVFYTDTLKCTVLHGACISIYGKNLLLIGERHAGKTTLTSYLTICRRGEYISDDSVYLVNSGYLGFCMPLPMRNMVLENSKNDYNQYILARTTDGDQVKRTLLHPPKVVDTVNDIDIVLFPKYSKNAISKIQAITSSNAFKLLIKNVHSYSNMKNMFTDIKVLSTHAKSYQIEYPDSHSAYEMLLMIMDKDK